MSTPTHIQMQYWMYPTGNTPAVNLLRDTPAYNDGESPIRVLCLACGDPRSILFTLWCEQTQGSYFDNALGFCLAQPQADELLLLDTRRHYHFTCCDIEPAILGEISAAKHVENNIMLISASPECRPLNLDCRSSLKASRNQ